MKKLIILLFSLLFINYSSAFILCTPNQVVYNVVEGQTPSFVDVQCVSSQPQLQVNMTKLGSFFSVSPSVPLTFDSNNPSYDLQLNFNTLAKGTYEGFLLFSDGSSPYKITYNVTSPPTPTCNLNPSLLSYSQSIQQGTSLSLPKIVFNPENCQGSLALSASTVTIQGGILTTTGQKPVYISSIEPNGINLNIDTTGLNTQQTYSSTLNIQAFGKTTTIPFNIVVTSGVKPATNFPIDNLPRCSFTSNIINLNNTYELTCNNIQPDVTVMPEIDSNYIIGIGTETSSSTYVWRFQPIKFGNTEIKAKFYLRNAPVGYPFKQELKIQSSGYIIAGTSLGVLFFPNLNTAKAGENVTIQLIDNSTGSLIEDGELLIDAVELNKHGNNFYFVFEPVKKYSMRARAVGYNDVVRDIGLELKEMSVNITPSSGDSLTTFRIETGINATLVIDNSRFAEPYIGALSAGEHQIVAVKEGYFDAYKNFTVLLATAISSTPYSFEKGENFIAYLNKNTSWQVQYQKDLESSYEILSTGNNSIVEFVPEESGYYYLVADGRTLTNGSFEIKGWDWKIAGINLFYWLGGAVALFIIFRLVQNNKQSSQGLGSFGGVGGSFGGQTN